MYIVIVKRKKRKKVYETWKKYNLEQQRQICIREDFLVRIGPMWLQYPSMPVHPPLFILLSLVSFSFYSTLDTCTLSLTLVHVLYARIHSMFPIKGLVHFASAVRCDFELRMRRSRTFQNCIRARRLLLKRSRAFSRPYYSDRGKFSVGSGSFHLFFFFFFLGSPSLSASFSRRVVSLITARFFCSFIGSLGEPFDRYIKVGWNSISRLTT